MDAVRRFIRANYLLKRCLRYYFGYDLQENFFTRTEPFNKMVVVNNAMDVLVNGKIKVCDLVPDFTCADFISVFVRSSAVSLPLMKVSALADIISLCVMR